jgi:predicted phosphodiesterase
MRSVRVAVLSDLHANLEAVDAVLAAADEAGCRATIVLGDIVGYGADPEAVVGRVVERGALAIAGNHDLAAVGSFDLAWFNDAAAAALRWTVEALSEEARAFLAGLAPTRPYDGGLLVHGSVRDPVAEYLLSADDARASFEAADFPTCLFGHTHLPTVFVCDPSGRVRGRVLADGDAVDLAPPDRFLLNPGSVGQPRDGDPRASFLVLDDGRAVLRRVPYPVERAAEKIRAAGLPARLADRLFVGE